MTGGKRGVHAAAVGQTGVDHRRGFVDPSAHAGRDPLDDPHQVFVIAEPHLRVLELAEPLDIHLIKAVDEDVGHGRIGHQRRQRTDAERFFQQLVGQAPPLPFVERNVFGGQHAIDKRPHLGPEFGFAGREQSAIIQFVEQPLMQPPLDRKMFRLNTPRRRQRLRPHGLSSRDACRAFDFDPLLGNQVGPAIEQLAGTNLRVGGGFAG